MADSNSLGFMEIITIEEKVVEALRTCYDPEIPVNIYELGLIYEVKVQPSGQVDIKMTLTKAKGVAGVTDAKVDLVWDPPWDPKKMSEAARLQIGMV